MNGYLKWGKIMANENKKDFNAMMNENKDMPKIQIVTDEKIIKKYGGSKMFLRRLLFMTN